MIAHATQNVADLSALRALLVETLFGRSDLKAKEERGLVVFRCPLPGHDDSTASAMLGSYAWNCKGCSGQGSGRLVDLAAALGMDVRLSGGRGYTVDDYAVEKGLPVHNLERWGLTTEMGQFGHEQVLIPYYGMDGNLLRRRIRVQKRAGKNDKWWEGQGGGVPGLYGLWMLAKVDAATPVLLVEGESDCHACWNAGILALGLPGADTWSHCRGVLPQLQDREVYVWEEADKGGAIILRAVAADLPNARVIHAEDAGAKDPCALRQQDADGFKLRMLALMQQAERIGTPKPPHVFRFATPDLLERIGQMKQQEVDAVPTHLPLWSDACRGRGGRVGLGRGWMVIVGGKQGGMKSLFKDNFTAAAMTAGERVCMVSMEMDIDENLTRLMCIIAGANPRALENGEGFDPAEWRRASVVMEQIREDRGGDVCINEEEISNLADIRDSMLYYHEYHGCRTFIIDYLQLAWVKYAKSREDQITEVSHEVRRLTKAHGWTTLALSQITREAAKLKETPIPSNLFGGSALESDAVQVGFMDHSRIRKATGTVHTGGRDIPYATGSIDTVFHLAKNRVGPSLLDVPVRLNTNNLRIEQRQLAPGDEW